MGGLGTLAAGGLLPCAWNVPGQGLGFRGFRFRVKGLGCIYDNTAFSAGRIYRDLYKFIRGLKGIYTGFRKEFSEICKGSVGINMGFRVLGEGVLERDC